MILEIKDLHVATEGKEIIKGLSLRVREGEFHVLMGPNGSGKTTLSKAIMGHPKMSVTKGEILIDGKSILKLSTDKRARLGLFLAFQNPVEIEGLPFMNFLNAARASLPHGEPMPFRDFMEQAKSSAKSLHMKDETLSRSLNYGLSGGEKKKLEILQIEALKPRIVILDEPDSGLT